MEEDRQKAEMERIRLTELKQLADKSKRYADLVREMYVPKIDPKKQLELKRRFVSEFCHWFYSFGGGGGGVSKFFESV